MPIAVEILCRLTACILNTSGRFVFNENGKTKEEQSQLLHSKSDN